MERRLEIAEDGHDHDFVRVEPFALGYGLVVLLVGGVGCSTIRGTETTLVIGLSLAFSALLQVGICRPRWRTALNTQIDSVQFQVRKGPRALAPLPAVGAFVLVVGDVIAISAGWTKWGAVWSSRFDLGVWSVVSDAIFGGFVGFGVASAIAYQYARRLRVTNGLQLVAPYWGLFGCEWPDARIWRVGDAGRDRL